VLFIHGGSLNRCFSMADRKVLQVNDWNPSWLPVFVSAVNIFFYRCPDRMNMPTMDACFNHRSSDFIKSNHVCGLLNHSLSRCSGSINATLHKMACVKALCKKDNFLQSLETALTGYVAECSIRTGIHFPNLRDNIGICEIVFCCAQFFWKSMNCTVF